MWKNRFRMVGHVLMKKYIDRKITKENVYRKRRRRPKKKKRWLNVMENNTKKAGINEKYAEAKNVEELM